MSNNKSKVLHGDLLLKGRQSAEFENIPPVMRMNYTYKHPFNAMTVAYLRKYVWEVRTQLTTVAGFEQTSDDEITYLRRCERITNTNLGWERVTINRRDKTMTTEALLANTDGSEGIMESHKFWADPDNLEFTKNELQSWISFDKGLKLEQYKFGIASTLKAMKFAQFEQEEA